MNDDSLMISIIVPVYNVEKYLDKCLKSLAQQTYNNIEIILLNDGSTDKSSAICDQYAKNDIRFRVVHNPNMGVSFERNYGISIALGDYIMFVDADDWLEKETCEEIVELFSSSNVDIIIFSYFKEFGFKSIPEHVFVTDKKVTSIDAKYLFNRIIGPKNEDLSNPARLDIISNVWGLAYSSKIIHSIKFVDCNDIGTGEDIVFNAMAFSKSANVLFLDKCYYHYRKNNRDSIISTYNQDLPQQLKRMHKILYEIIF